MKNNLLQKAEDRKKVLCGMLMTAADVSAIAKVGFFSKTWPNIMKCQKVDQRKNLNRSDRISLIFFPISSLGSYNTRLPGWLRMSSLIRLVVDVFDVEDVFGQVGHALIIICCCWCRWLNKMVMMPLFIVTME